MILYRKDFPLGKGVSYSRYIKTLDEINFYPFTLLISEISGTMNYHIEIVITDPMRLWGWHSSLIGGVLLSECTILYSKGERYFTLQAFAKKGNLIFASFNFISPILLFIFVLFIIVAKHTMSFNSVIILAIISILMSAPSTTTYLRDKKFLDRVGSIGKELETT